LTVAVRHYQKICEKSRFNSEWLFVWHVMGAEKLVNIKTLKRVTTSKAYWEGKMMGKWMPE